MRTPLYGNKLTIVAVLLPVIIYFIVLSHFAVNVPIADDFDSILFFLNAESSLKLKLLFSQHNEHRLFFNRITVWIFYRLFGEINFSHLIYFANAALVIIFMIIARSVSAYKTQGILYALPITLIIFQLQNWENMTWAMAALQNYYVIVFALLALYFFGKKTSIAFFTSLIFATLATYTSGSGILIFITLILWSLTDKFTKNLGRNDIVEYDTQKKTILIMWFLLVGVLYFCSYISSNNPATPFSLNFANYFLTLTGYYVPVVGIAKYIGLGTLIWFSVITYKQYYIKNPLCYYAIIWILGCLFLISLGRSSFGIEWSFASRYKVLSTLLLALIYCSMIELFAEKISKTMLYLIIMLCIIFNIVSFYIGFYELSVRKTSLTTGIEYWIKTKQDGLFYPGQIHASSLLQKSIDNKVYTLPLINMDKPIELIEFNFDSEFYWQKYPDVAVNKLYGKGTPNGAWLHWVRYGKKEGRFARKKN